MDLVQFPCPKCRQPMIIPSGSSKPRCQSCEPVELWLEAAAAWEADGN